MTAVDSIQGELVCRYRLARRAFRQPSIAEACATIGMSEREYCDRYIGQMGPIWQRLGGATGAPYTPPLDPFIEAGRDL
jgi:hypothetical protein